MSNHALPHGVERRRQIWRFEQPGSAEKNFLAKIARNLLISLVSDERIQGNPTFKSWGFRRETASGQEKPNEGRRTNVGLPPPVTPPTRSPVSARHTYRESCRRSRRRNRVRGRPRSRA